MTPTRIALIGDHDPEAKAHQGIPRALALASAREGPCEWQWRHTSTLLGDVSGRLAAFHGLWCVPGSPYANTRGAIAAIRLARTTGLPFLGTCGGFQHALLEYAASVWDIADASHAELDPDAQNPVIAPLACSLVEQSGEVRFEPGSRLATIYNTDVVTENYHCSYGLNPAYADRLAAGLLRASGRDPGGDIRAIELEAHPFFVATLFQPERSGLLGREHPLIRAFVAAARVSASRT